MPPSVINHLANEFLTWRMPADLSAIATKNTFKDRNYPIAAIIRQLYDTFVTLMISINI